MSLHFKIDITQPSPPPKKKHLKAPEYELLACKISLLRRAFKLQVMSKTSTSSLKIIQHLSLPQTNDKADPKHNLQSQCHGKSRPSPGCDWPRYKPWKGGENPPKADRTHRIPEPGHCWCHWQSWGNSSKSLLACVTQTFNITQHQEMKQTPKQHLNPHNQAAPNRRRVKTS